MGTRARALKAGICTVVYICFSASHLYLLLDPPRGRGHVRVCLLRDSDAPTAGLTLFWSCAAQCEPIARATLASAEDRQ